MNPVRNFARWLFALPDAGEGAAPHEVLAGLDLLLMRNDRRLVQALLVFIMGPLFWFLGMDLILFSGDWPRLEGRVALRLLAALLILAGMLAVRASEGRKNYSRAVLGVALTIALLQLANNLLRPQGAALPLRTPLMFLIMMYGALPNSLGRQIVPPLLYTAGIVAERAWWVTDNTSGDFASDVLIVLFVNAIGVVMVYRRAALEREIAVRFQAEQQAAAMAQRALADLRTLRGIIPICSHCRKVRSEVGDWQQLEQYVAEHSEADFSHGVCPNCLRQHYPGTKAAQR